MWKQIKIFLIIFIFCFYPIFLSAQTDTDKNELKSVLKKFEQAWETKDITLLKQCFHKLSDRQLKMYNTLFPIIDKADIEFEFKEIYIDKIFAGVKTKMKKNIRYKMEQIHGLTQNKEENINYLFMKKNNKWGIIGTVHPDEKKKTVQITENNIDQINENLKKIPEDKRQQVFQSYSILSDKRNKINFKKSALIYSYQITLNSKQNSKDKNNKIIWKKDNHYIPFVEIPSNILKELETNNTYYLKVIGYDKKTNEIEGYVFNLKYIKE